MDRKIQFNFNGHSGAWAARPVECPLGREVCALGTMSYKKEWLVYRKVGKQYEICPHFMGLGPDVPKEGTSDSFPIIALCTSDIGGICCMCGKPIPSWYHGSGMTCSKECSDKLKEKQDGIRMR